MASCLGAHLQREDGDGAGGLLVRVLILGGAQQRAGGAERDFGRERGLAHAGAPGKNHEVGGVQATDLFVEVTQARGEAADVPGLLEGALGPLDRIGQRALERDEAAIAAALGGELEQLRLGRFDLAAAVDLGFGAERVVDGGLADVDQLPPDPGIMDRAAILAGIDDADHRGEQLRKIGGAAHLFERAGMLELGLQRDRVGEFARLRPGARWPGRCAHAPGPQSGRARESH